MAVEEVGAKLVAYGEEEFVKAFNDCQKSIDHLASSMAEADKATQKTSGQMDIAKKKFTVFGQSLTDIKSGFEMAFGALEKGYAFVKTFIDSASNMNETISKSKVVFGDMADAVEDMGNRAAQSMGLSKQEAIAAAATYGNLFTSMGMTKDVSADMSMNLVQLASDFASFNNIPVADALEKIRAGLVGEAEPLKSLGVNINEAALKQEALSLGLTKGNEVLSASAKAQAAYSLMLKQSANAQGDFARTSDQVANQQRILEASVKDLTAQMGKNLLPAWNSILKVANATIGTYAALITVDERLVAVLNQHQKEVAATATNYDTYIKEMKRAAAVAGYEVDAEGNLIKAYTTHGVKVREVVEKNYALTDSMFWAGQQAKATEIDMVDFASSLATQASAADLAAAATNRDKLAQQTLQAEINKVNDLMVKYSSQMLYAKAAEGLTADQALILAQQMGLIDSSTATALGQLDKFRGELDNGKISAEGYASKVSSLDSWIRKLENKEITLTTYYKEVYQSEWHYGSTWGKIGGAAEGGPIPGGKPTWVGERGPELFIPNMGGTVIPNDAINMMTRSIQAMLPSLASIGAGSGVNNYSNSNNYNLNVMTSQSPQVVQRSFAMMKLLAG